MVPTAIELIENKFPNNNGVFVLRNIEEFMIEFAQLHVEEALKKASLTRRNGFYDSEKEEKEILNAYPLDKIK
jgi:hypothetical protein